MAHPNEALLRKGYAAFASYDLDTIRALFADDIVWHVLGGRNQLSGTIKGKDEVFGWFAKLLTLSDGTFNIDVHDVIANDDHAVVISHDTALRLIKAVQWQLEHWDEIPVIMVPCLRGISWPLPWIYKSSRYGSIYPAIQNLLLAARAEGLGAALTTFPLWNRVAARRILRLPLNVEPIACIPMGWPQGKYGPTTRRPVEEFTHLDRHGNLAFKP